MAEIYPDVKTRTSVSVQGGTFQIVTVSSYSAFGSGGAVPDISAAELLHEPAQIDGVSGKEGELILSMGDYSDAWLDGEGRLVVNPDPRKDTGIRYSIDAPEGNLMYKAAATVYSVDYSNAYNKVAQIVNPDNILHQIGDVMYINVNALIRGRLTMNSVLDSWSGDGEVQGEFRVNVDSIFYTDWLPLTADNLASSSYDSNSVLRIQVRFTRVSGEGDLSFNSLTIGGIWFADLLDAPTLISSLFSSVLDSPLLKKIDDNLFKKLYFRGVVPQYITRAENVSYDEDRDYVSLFSTVSYFFSLLIAFFKRFENFRNDEELLREHVRGWGIRFDEGNITLEQLQYLAENYYSQIQQRGTAMIAVREGDILPNGKVAEIDGELLRLLQSAVYNELLIGTIADYKMGWCMRNSSPMYRGTCREVTLNKTRENTEDFQFINNYPIATSGSVTVDIVSSLSKKVLRVSATGSGIGGIGRIVNSQFDISNYLITADPEISYEITIAFRMISGTRSDVNIYFGVEGFNDNGEKLNDSFVNLNGEVADGLFFQQSYDIWKTDMWYYARGIIHSYSTTLFAGEKTNLGVGSDLAFNNPFVRYISPRILVNAYSAAVVEFWDYKVRPLVRGKSIMPYRNGNPANSHSLCFIQARDFMYTYARNNNKSLSQEEITDIIEKYLYPYGKTNMFVFAGGK